MNKKIVSKVVSIIFCIVLAMTTVVEAKPGKSSSARSLKSSISSSSLKSSSSNKQKSSLESSKTESAKAKSMSSSTKKSSSVSTKENKSDSSSKVKDIHSKTNEVNSKVKSGNFSKSKPDLKDKEITASKYKSKKENDENKSKANTDFNKSSIKADSENFTVKPKTIDKNKEKNTSTNNSPTYKPSYYKNYSKSNFFSTNNAWFYYYALDKVFNNRDRVTEQDIARELEERGYTEKEIDTIMLEGKKEQKEVKKEISNKKNKNIFKYITIGSMVCILGWIIYIKKKR